ncbi:MAG TPA: TonB-dependent receptor [Bryobacteraceae bacterium]|nr:TonB-dependent receptor [Bryobacteraceae bacterium]
MLHRRLLFRIFLLFPLAAGVIFGQPGAAISGLVKDAQGAAIPGASVTLVARDNTFTTAATTDSEGRYQFSRVAPGAYLLQADAPGFAASTSQPLAVGTEAVILNFHLHVAAIRSTVVVTASGTAQDPDEISKSISVVGRDSIDTRDEYSITDSLRYLPGLRVEQLGGPGSFVSIKMRGLRNEDTAVTIDGFRLRDAASTQGDASALLQDLLVTDTDRIEVMRGSGSSIYGTDATGGVVNLITDQGSGATHGTFLAEGGSLGMFRGRTGVAGGLDQDKLHYSLGLAHLNVTEGVGGDLPARTTDLQSRLDYSLSPTTQLFGRIFAADSFSKVSSSPQAFANLPPGVIDAAAGLTFLPDADNPDYTRAQRIFSGALRLSSHPTESIGVSASYQALITRRRFGDGPAGSGFQPDGSTLSFYDGDIHTADARIDWQAGRYQLIDAGYEFEDERYGNHSLLPDPAGNSAVDVSQRSHALFVQDQAHLLGDRVQLTAAYRAQFFSLEQPQLTPAASAPYAGLRFAAPPTAQTADGSAAYFLRRTGTKFRAHIGRGYRAPSLYERFGTYYDSFGGYSAFGDPRLQPEHLLSVDTGIDQSLAHGRARLSATYFYTQLQSVIIFDTSGLITPATDPFGRFGGYRNTNGGLARGAELSASLSPLRTLNLQAAYTYTNARERTPLADGVIQSYATPAHQFSLIATERLTSRITFEFQMVDSSNYLYPMFDPITFASRAFRFPGMWDGELGGSYRIPFADNRALRFFAKARNIFDQTYYEGGYRTPGATGTGGLQFEF